MLTINGPADVKNHIGIKAGPSDWVTVDQAMINAFADATGDHQWIHIDTERAKHDIPNGKTIAHGFLLLSLLPGLSAGVSDVANVSRALNYGSDKVRFLNMVPAGSKVRMYKTYTSATDMTNGGVRVVALSELEIDGEEKPALIAETIALLFP